MSKRLRSDGPAQAVARRLAPLPFVLAALVALPPPALAQDASLDHPAVQRYNRAAKGANVEEWQRRLGEQDARTRLEAVESLGSKGGDEAIRPLIEATADADPRVRIKAIDYLGLMRANEAIPVLMQLLFLSDVGREEKLRSLTSLGRIADPSTSQRLLAYARTIDDHDLACRALYALGEIGDPSTRAGIEELRRDRTDEDFTRVAQEALAKIDRRAAIRPVEQPTLIELERKLAPRDAQR